MTEDKITEPCPSISGGTIGYEIEYLNEDKIWKPLHLDQYEIDKSNAPSYPRWDGKYISAMGLLGFEQANAIVWMCAAERIAGDSLKVEQFRLVPYKIEFSVKAYRNEDDSIEIETGKP